MDLDHSSWHKAKIFFFSNLFLMGEESDVNTKSFFKLNLSPKLLVNVKKNTHYIDEIIHTHALLI